MAPSTSATSPSLSVAKAPMVSIPSLRRRSSATGPIPQSLRTGSAESNACSSARPMIRIPSGFASPEAILATCLPEPAPTDATNPVSASTRDRSASQNSSTSDTAAPTSSAGSPNASSKDSCSSTGTTDRTVAKTRRLAVPYTAPRGGRTTAPAPTSLRA